MPPQTLQEQEAEIAKRFGGVLVAPGTPTPEEEAIAKRFGGVPTPRTEADAIRERMAARIGATPPPSDTFAGAYSEGTNTLAGLWDLAKGAITHPIDTAGNFLGSMTGMAGVPRLEQDIKSLVTQPSQEQGLQTLQSVLGVLPLGIGTFATSAREQLSDTSKPLSELLPRVAGQGAALATNLALTAPTEAAAAAHKAGAPARAAIIQKGKIENYIKLTKQAFPEMDAGQIRETIPHMAAEHAVTPIATVEDFIAAKDRAIGNIETHVQSAVDAFPNEIVQVPVRQIEDALDRGLGGPKTPPSRGMGTRATDIDKGMKAIESLGLDQPMSLPDMYDRLLRLNSELRKALSESKYDVAAMRQSDPVFRAIELAAEHARKVVYERLDQLGVSDVAKLRADEGALIETRNAAYSKRLQGEAPVRVPGGVSIGQQVVNQVIKRLGRVVGAVGGDTVEGAVNRLQGGPKPRNVVIERATRNLEGLQGPGFQPIPGPLPTVNVQPPGGPNVPAGPGLPPGPPPTGVGFPRWQPPGQGPLPTVTVMPPTGPPGLPPATPPLALNPAPPRQLGPAVREMPAPNQAPDYRAPAVSSQTLPTTWEELKRFYQGEDITRGTGQQPNIILDILSLPPEERAAAIAEIERSTPPPEPPDTYTPRGGGTPPAPTTPPAPAGPPPTPPPAPTSAAPTVPPRLKTTATAAPANGLVTQLRNSLMKTGVSDVPVATWRDRFATATPEDLQALAAHLRGPNSTSWATKVLLPEVNRALTEARTQPSLVGAEAVRSQEVPQPQFEVPEQGFNLSAPEETQPTQTTLGEAAAPTPMTTAQRFKAGRPTARVPQPLSDEEWAALDQQNALSSPGDAGASQVPAPSGPSVPVGDTLPAERPLGRASDAGSGANRPQKTGVAAISPSLAEHFDGLLQDARRQGFTGTPDELATEYQVAVEKARQVARDLADDSYVHVHEDLLKAISDAGGMSMSAEGAGGMRGEIRSMLESLTKGSKLIRRGAQAGKGRYMPRPVAGTKGAPGILRMKGGMSADYMLEHLQQDPQFQHRWSGLPDFLEDVNHAIQEATGQRTAPEAKMYDLKGILEGALGVRPGEQWWTPF